MTVQLVGLWRLDYGALEAGERIALINANDSLVCELRVRWIEGSEDRLVVQLVVEGPPKLLAYLEEKHTQYGSGKISDPIFVMVSMVEQGAGMSFSPTYSLGVEYRINGTVTRVCQFPGTPDEIPVPDLGTPVVQRV